MINSQNGCDLARKWLKEFQEGVRALKETEPTLMSRLFIDAYNNQIEELEAGIKEWEESIANY